jgi:hypothetical protein
MVDDETRKDMLEEAEADQPKDESLVEKVEKAVDLKSRIEETEAELKKMKKDLERVQRDELPNLLSEIGVVDLTVQVGNRHVTIEMDHKFFGSISKAPSIDEALSYLDEHGFDGEVKTNASVDLRRSEAEDEETVTRIREALEREAGKDVHLERKVHPQTLMAFAREKVADDPSFDAGKIGIDIVRQAKISIK